MAIRPEAEGADAALQKRIREESCKIFSTVLGPGSDPAHDNHFHFDIRQRDGDYRICQ
ncbi:MAG: extensin family protein [Loktanella sp.]|nr:extensin family protein [Loktanella sp.]